MLQVLVKPVRSRRDLLVAGGLAAVVLAAAALLRFPHLGRRPMHTDEAVQAVIAGQVLETGRYRYDPQEFHGPALPLAGALALRLCGVRTLADATEPTLRSVPAAAGIVAVLLVLFLLRRRPSAALAASALAACSPLLVYYNRYYIHESLLVLFSLWFTGAVFSFLQRPQRSTAVSAGLALGFAAATKETWVLHLAAGVLGAAAFACVSRRPGPPAQRLRRPLRPTLATAATAAAGFAVPVLVLFSWFGTHPRGILDAVRAFSVYTGRSHAGNHIHAWHYYARLLIGRPFVRGPHWTEAFILVLLLAGAAALVIPRWRARIPPALRRLFAGYAAWGAALFVLYSLLPYKTPWCAMTFWLLLICAAGVGFGMLWTVLGTLVLRLLISAVFVLGTANLFHQARLAGGPFATHRCNPWVYVHTSPDVLHLTQRIDDIARVTGAGRDLLICVTASEYWPLPWYLRRYRRVGYWTEPHVLPGAQVILASPEFCSALREAGLSGRWEQQFYGLRPGVPIVLMIPEDTWNQWLRQHAGAVRNQGNSTQNRTASANSAREPVSEFRHPAMNAEFRIRIRGINPAYAAQAVEAAFSELDRIEGILSRFVSTSDVSRVNAAEAGRRIAVDPAVIDCLKVAREVWEHSGGAFDVTYRRSRDGKDSDAPRLQSDMTALHWTESPPRIWKDRGDVRIDLGGVGKGFALDRMAGVLADWGVRDALLEGGESTALVVGDAADRPWALALRHPRDPDRTLAHFRLAYGAFSGSSAVLHPGHIIDPRTGRPARAALAAWAAAPTGAEADAWSTAFMVLGPDEGAAICSKRTDLLGIVLILQEDRPRLKSFGKFSGIRSTSGSSIESETAGAASRKPRISDSDPAPPGSR